VTLEADDGEEGSGVELTEYSVDGGAFQDYTEPFTVNENGEHTVTYRSIDNSGNQESDKTVSWTRLAPDDAPPTTTHSLDPSSPDGDNGWYMSPVEVTLSADDGIGLGVESTEYRIDGAPYQPYTAPFEVSDPGIHTISYRSTDAGTNVESPNTVSFKIDAAAPASEAALTPSAPNGNEGWYRSQVTVAISAADGAQGSGVADTTYSVDGGPAQSYSAPFSVSGIGMHEVAFSSTDLAGNAEPEQTIEFKIDATPPATTHALSGDWSKGGTVNVALAAQDQAAGSGVESTEYRIGTKPPLGPTSQHPFQPYTGPIAVSGDGRHYVEYRSVDVAGNGAAARHVRFVIGSPPPDNLVPPLLEGSGNINAKLICNPGEWTQTGPYSYRWYRDGEEIENPDTAKPQKYVPRNADQGSEISCEVRRTSRRGPSVWVGSNPVTVAPSGPG
jgi:hypothetical protein